jgi:uncharacterized protein YggL (DUF469 family)
VNIEFGELKNASVVNQKGAYFTELKVQEWDGTVSIIRIPAKSFQAIEQAIVENWLENKKLSIF